MNILLIYFSLCAFASGPLPFSIDAYQLQQLINKSEAQLQVLNESLNQDVKSERSLQKVSKHLESLSAGIDESIQKYQGSKVFEKAMIEIQARNDFSQTYSDSQGLRKYSQRKGNQENKMDKLFEDLVKYQKESVQANKEALKQQELIQKALETAPPGMVSKLLVEAQIGNWQASTRLSSQLTEMIASMNSIREELRIERLAKEDSDPLKLLIRSTEVQNAKQRGLSK